MQLRTLSTFYYQQLYTPPHVCIGLFFTFWAGFGYKFFVPKFYKTFAQNWGGGADVCPPGVTMCVHPVSLARRTWIGRTSAGPILILWGGEWWLLFGTYHLWLSLPYILGRFLSTIFVSNSWSQNSILLNWKFRLLTRSIVKLCSLVMENIRFNKNSVC